MELDNSVSGCQWLQLQADDYCCTVSLQTLRKFPDSLLAGLADTAVAHGREQLRLDMSPQVAAEVVSVLRLGEGYAPPEDTRLVAALQVMSIGSSNTPHDASKVACSSRRALLLLAHCMPLSRLLLFTITAPT